MLRVFKGWGVVNQGSTLGQRRCLKIVLRFIGFGVYDLGFEHQDCVWGLGSSTDPPFLFHVGLGLK